MVTWPSGKARVCKTLIHQFKSGRHLQIKWSFWITATFFVVAAKESGVFALQKFAVGQMITQGITAGFQGLRAALKVVSRALKGENPHLFLLFLKKGGVFDVEILTDILCNM